jgi:hypothetical protein
MSLETVGKLVAAHSSMPSSNNESKLDKVEVEKAIAGRMFKWLIWGILIFGLATAMLVVNKSFDLGKWFGLAAMFFLLAGAGVATFGVLNAIREGATNSGRTSAKNISGGPDIKSLPTERIPVPMPSVTERTTELISHQDVSKPSE